MNTRFDDGDFSSEIPAPSRSKRRHAPESHSLRRNHVTTTRQPRDDHAALKSLPGVDVVADPVGGGRDPVVNSGLSGFPARESGRDQPDQNPAAIGLLNLGARC
jgi:hypothetical protein